MSDMKRERERERERREREREREKEKERKNTYLLGGHARDDLCVFGTSAWITKRLCQLVVS